MKTILTFLFSILFFSQLHAHVFTVNNNPIGTAAQYTQVNPAINAANAGDTILVSGSAYTYADFTISKSLTLIGPGTFSPKQFNYPATVNSIIMGGGVSNVSIRGFKIIGSLDGFNNGNISFVTITDNYFTNNAMYYAGITNVHDVIFSNNIITGGGRLTNVFNTSGCYNFLIENNLVNGFIENFNIPNSTVQNNVFYNIANAFNASTTVVSGITIKNNIFYNAHPSNGTSTCVFSNNLTYSSSVTYPALGGSNFDNQDPQFVNVGNSGGYNSSYNFSLPASSPGHNAGTDGTDVGYYGGGMRVSVIGEPQNVPVIREMDVQNGNVLQNGNVNVKVRSTIAR